MGIEVFLAAVVLLALFALFDLVVGVSNDAVNFLNSSIGSRVAPRRIILAVASLGILAGVGFSGGMMEVARKGIFHPQLFTMPELIMLFLGVMIADILLLDLFNSVGLPTSTTVSIVFELLGAAVAISALKISEAGEGVGALSAYINSGKALVIIFGILLSVVVAFVAGAIVQILSRLLFTFDYVSRLRRYGALWGGVALASITYFILVKGAKGTSFVPPEAVEWIQGHTIGILLGIFAVSAVLLHVLVLMGVNILKPIVLIGTFALAMAFAANDLVNFIGVPMAGLHAYQAAGAAPDPLNATMEAMGGKVHSETYLLLIAGAVMVLTLCFSRKARSVTKTEIGLGDHAEGEERFESTSLSRRIVRMVSHGFQAVRRVIPEATRRGLARRLHRDEAHAATAGGAPFDLLRASVNLMVASAVISYATSYKLPLSTTYVTFMVAMGASFADLAWGRESAVYRVTGVLTVIGGWFLTAVLAFLAAGTFALVIYLAHIWGVIALLALVVLTVWRNHLRHQERSKTADAEEVFNLKKVADVEETVSTTFEHMGLLIHEIRTSLDASMGALFVEDLDTLRREAKRAKKVQRWANIITANIFKALRLLQRRSTEIQYRYAQTARRLQKLADGHRDAVIRAYRHVSNHHKGLLPVQVEELSRVRRLLHDLLEEVESTVNQHGGASLDSVTAKDRALREYAEELNLRQIDRIRDGSAKTRLSILYYSLVGNALMLSKQVLRLTDSFTCLFTDEGSEERTPEDDANYMD